MPGDEPVSSLVTRNSSPIGSLVTSMTASEVPEEIGANSAGLGRASNPATADGTSVGAVGGRIVAAAGSSLRAGIDGTGEEGGGGEGGKAESGKEGKRETPFSAFSLFSFPLSTPAPSLPSSPAPGRMGGGTGCGGVVPGRLTAGGRSAARGSAGGKAESGKEGKRETPFSAFSPFGFPLSTPAPPLLCSPALTVGGGVTSGDRGGGTTTALKQAWQLWRTSSGKFVASAGVRGRESES